MVECRHPDRVYRLRDRRTSTPAPRTSRANRWRARLASKRQAYLASPGDRLPLGSAPSLVPEEGFEPSRGLPSVDFESTASTIPPLRLLWLKKPRRPSRESSRNSQAQGLPVPELHSSGIQRSRSPRPRLPGSHGVFLISIRAVVECCRGLEKGIPCSASPRHGARSGLSDSHTVRASGDDLDPDRSGLEVRQATHC